MVLDDLGTRLSRAVLYGLGPFFGHPLKPALSLLCGDGYRTAYEHFRRDHSRADNLVLHLICLMLQLLANFALLGKLDDALLGSGGIVAPSFSSAYSFVGTGPTKLNLSTATVHCWIALLVFSGAPPICSAASAASIVSALYAVAVAVGDEGGWGGWALANMQAVAIASFLSAMFLMVGPSKKALKLGAFWVGWLLLWKGAAPGFLAPPVDEYGGSQDASATYYAVHASLVGLLLAIPALLSDPVVATVATGAIVLNAASLRYEGDGRPSVLHFWCMAYVAMGLQATAHSVSAQPATLLNLQEEKGKAGDGGGGDGEGKDSAASKRRFAVQRTRFEWSHVSFFPDLLFHSCYESLANTRQHGKDDAKRKEKEAMMKKKTKQK